MFTTTQYRVLKTLFPQGPNLGNGTDLVAKSKLVKLFGDEVLNRIAGRVIIDFGCGEGTDAVELANRKALRVIGLDNREEVLQTARRNAAAAGVDQVCRFVTSTDEIADMIVSVDSFEHFEDPLLVLQVMDKLLKPDGEVAVSFGPTWYHPLGGHSFSIFPWSHLLFSEQALIRWRLDYRDDGARKFSEIGGGLNQITVAQFEKVVSDSPFKFASFETVPIRRLRPFHNRLTREFTSAIVRCRLVKKLRAGA